MPNSTNETASEFPGIPMPRADVKALSASTLALKQSVDVLTGAAGNGNNQAVTAAQFAALQARVAKLEAAS